RLIGNPLPGRLPVPALAPLLAVLETHQEIDGEDDFAAPPHDHLRLEAGRSFGWRRWVQAIQRRQPGPGLRHETAGLLERPAPERRDLEIDRPGPLDERLDRRTDVDSGAGMLRSLPECREKVPAGGMTEAVTLDIRAQGLVEDVTPDHPPERLQDDVGLVVDEADVRSGAEPPGGRRQRIIPRQVGVSLPAGLEAPLRETRQIEVEGVETRAEEAAAGRPEGRLPEADDLIEVERSVSERDRNALAQHPGRAVGDERVHRPAASPRAERFVHDTPGDVAVDSLVEPRFFELVRRQNAVPVLVPEL